MPHPGQSFTNESGKTDRVFVSTMRPADDLANTGLRRLLVNATYWAVGLENQIPANADVTLVGDYHPHSYLSETFTSGVKPSDLALTTPSKEITAQLLRRNLLRQLCSAR
jgi:hypothetical protein